MSENFIMQSYIEDLSLCDDLIEFFKKNPQHHKPGCVSDFKVVNGEVRNVGTVRPYIKESIDLVDKHLTDELRNRYYGKALNNAIKQYIEKYEYSLMCPFGFKQPGNIQYYKPGMAFHKFHCERSDVFFPTTTRHLAWMTYLNDVNDGGETEFYYQKLKVKPRKGLTIIWPADWTHTHKGHPSLTEEKYIITGWVNYIERDLTDMEYDKVVVVD